MGRISLVLLLGAIVAWIGYAWVGETLIRQIHQGQLRIPFGDRPILNPDKPTEFYLRLGNEAVRGLILYLLLGIGALHMFRSLTIEPGKRARFLGAFGVFVFAAVYGLNPNERIVSGHGFLHIGVVFQCFNGAWPPTNPLLAGEPLLYPWGHHFLVALLCRVLNTTPAWSFAIINLIALALCILLISTISRRLSHDPDSHVFSVMVGLFASSLMARPILDYLSTQAGFLIDWRAMPAGQKFICINGAPTGMVFFLLSAVSLIRLAEGHQPRRHSLLLFLAVAGCGFTYPLMLPAVCASCGLVAFVLAVRQRILRRVSMVRLAQILIPAGLGVLIVLPYLRQISNSDTGPKIQFIQTPWIFHNGLTVIVVLGPILSLIALRWKSLRSRWNPEVALFLATIIVACLGCYLGIHMFHYAEYKALILVGIGVGIFGGMALADIRTRLHPLPFLLLVSLFLHAMFYYLIPIAVSHSWVRTPLFLENGTTLSFYDPQQDQLYRWIRDETPSNSVFLDSSLDIPVFGRRSLYIGWVGKSDPDFREEGYGVTMDDWLGSQSGYNPELLATRNRIIRAIYSTDQPVSPVDLAELRRFSPLFIVIRNPALFPRFSGDDFQSVFQDSTGLVRVVRLRCP
jgi:hypothetical protein